MRDEGRSKEALREHEIFLNKIEAVIHSIDNTLDRLVDKVGPVSVERPSCCAKMDPNEREDTKAPMLEALYKQLDKLQRVAYRVDYITESIEI